MLEFNITGQSIKRIDRFSPATDSVDYLMAKFNFSTTDWDGKTKKALFRSGSVSYEAAINASGVCKVPFEVLIAPENKFAAFSGGCIKIFVSVVGTSGTIQIPTNECRVEISTSGLTETINGADPTPNVYEQFVTTIQADNDITVAEIKADNDETAAEVEALTERAETAKASAEQSAASMKNDYCNALKGIASGEVVRVDDVSPVEHTAKAVVHGDNVIPYPYEDTTKTSAGITFTDNKDGTIRVCGTSTGHAVFNLNRSLVFESGVNYELYVNTNIQCFVISYLDETGATQYTNNKLKDGVMWDSSYIFKNAYLQILPNTTLDITIYPQLRRKIDPTTVTVTEETTGATYTPAADGSCNIVSSPTMTLLTDTEGVTVDLEYNRDINKVIAEILNKVGA